MNFKDDRIYLGFDDVALVPQYSDVDSRRELNLTSGKLRISPFIPANMRSVTGTRLAHSIISYGGMPILHRFYSGDEEFYADVKSVGAVMLPHMDKVGMSVGVDDLKRHTTQILEATQILQMPPVICVDVAHAHSAKAIAAMHYYREQFPRNTIIGGNVGTAEGAEALFDTGVDIVKVGISNGAVCTTRVATGHGVPSITSISDVAEVANNREKEIIADGGIKTPSDAAKAIAAGAHYVMIGRMFAQCKESAGRKMGDPRDKHTTLTEYYGSASFANTSSKRMVEGEASWLPVKYSVLDLLSTLSDGLASAMSYSGAKTIDEYMKKAQFIRVSAAGYQEGLPHALLS